jgi:hypothetical protein
LGVLLCLWDTRTRPNVTPFMASAVRRANRKDLAALKALLEAR